MHRRNDHSRPAAQPHHFARRLKQRLRSQRCWIYLPNPPRQRPHKKTPVGSDRDSSAAPVDDLLACHLQGCGVEAKQVAGVREGYQNVADAEAILQRVVIEMIGVSKRAGSPDLATELLKLPVELEGDHEFWNNVRYFIQPEREPPAAPPGGRFPVHLGRVLAPSARAGPGSSCPRVARAAPGRLRSLPTLRGGPGASGAANTRGHQEASGAARSSARSRRP